ncbi:Rab GDP dissociation inhibitor [Nematocida displodere]|uniref:Rab GDP dissociation inhibitor n=1 Tax=Nematocida displodere TaxID=1805483 RepID=A0A177ECM1_9MICR|nr:Rab GDP dissociation inhibitor [Nematocida displodere]
MNHPTGEEAYDCLILGTGVKESILAGLLSTSGLKILQVDASSTYGSSSMTLRFEEFTELMQKKYPKNTSFHSQMKLENFSIDLTPKIFLADEGLVKAIGEHNLSHCIDFSVIEAQYMVDEKRHTLLIPATKTAALTSNLCGPFQLIKLNRFMNMIKSYYVASPSDKKRIQSQWTTVDEMYHHYGISLYIQKILGHGVALHSSDAYLNEAPHDFIMRLTTYFRSVARISSNKTGSTYGNSPFLYPRYGISEISQGFARLSAVKGGTTRMATEIVSMEATPEGWVVDLKSEDVQDRVLAGRIVANNDYHASLSPDAPTSAMYVIRGVVILRGVAKPASRQAMVLDIPTCDHDLFLLVVGSDESVCPEGYAIAYITGVSKSDQVTSEETWEYVTNNTEYHAMVTLPAMDLLYSWGYSVLHKMVWVETATSLPENQDIGVIPLRPMDNTVDFRSVHEEVMQVFNRIKNE